MLINETYYILLYVEVIIYACKNKVKIISYMILFCRLKEIRF